MNYIGVLLIVSVIVTEYERLRSVKCAHDKRVAAWWSAGGCLILIGTFYYDCALSYGIGISLLICMEVFFRACRKHRAKRLGPESSDERPGV